MSAWELQHALSGLVAADVNLSRLVM